MKVKIAIVQLQVDLTDAGKTLAKAESFVKRASGKADILVLPEYIVSWNFVDDGNFKRGQKSTSLILSDAGKAQ